MSVSRFLGDHSAHALDKRLTKDSVVIQPLGAIEAHGPHLPLSTDLVLAEALATAAVAAHGDALDLWLLPTMAYSKSNEHAWAPGTFWLTAQTMLLILDDLARCLAMTAAKTLVFVNAHGGNSALLQVACRDIRLKYGLRTFLLHPWVATDGGNELGMSIHAGHDETSLMMHVRPDLVDLSLGVRRVPEHLADNKHVKFGGSVSFGWLSNDFDDPTPATSSTGRPELSLGIIGDPTGASANHGKWCFDQIIETMGQQLDEVRRFDPRIRPT
jgi:creatinine amidohydrolase